MIEKRDLLWTDPKIRFDGSEVEMLVGAGKRKKKHAKFIDDKTQETFTVGQVASLFNLSEDTIRRLFENEPGVLSMGDRNPRGKRRRVTIRIPREVMSRVKRKMANK